MKKLIALTLTSGLLFTGMAFADENLDMVMPITTLEVNTQDLISNNYIVHLDTKPRLETFKKALKTISGAKFGTIIFTQGEGYIVTVELNSGDDIKKVEAIDGVLSIEKDQIIMLDATVNTMTAVTYNVDTAFQTKVEGVFAKLNKLSSKKKTSVLNALSAKIDVTLKTKKVSSEKEEKLKYLQDAVEKASK